VIEYGLDERFATAFERVMDGHALLQKSARSERLVVRVDSCDGRKQGPEGTQAVVELLRVRECEPIRPCDFSHQREGFVAEDAKRRELLVFFLVVDGEDLLQDGDGVPSTLLGCSLLGQRGLDDPHGFPQVGGRGKGVGRDGLRYPLAGNLGKKLRAKAVEFVACPGKFLDEEIVWGRARIRHLFGRSTQAAPQFHEMTHVRV
jgi:hypothetical protein